MSEITMDTVRDLIERHSDHISGNTREFYNGAYAEIADELNATFGGGECEFTVEYDRDEVERRRKMYEENPFGLFPQDMPQSVWTCSNCGQQFKCHYNRHTGELLPVPSWIKHCPNCGKAVKRDG